MLGAVATVILDEVHAVAGTKRGTHLITAVDRLVRLAGEFQRVALSATVRPLPRIARFVGGWVRHGHGETASYRPRPVARARGRGDEGLRDDRRAAGAAAARRRHAAGARGSESARLAGAGMGAHGRCAAGRRGGRRARYPTRSTSVPGFAGPQRSEDFWRPFVAALRERIRANRTTLIFTNSRRMAEKLTRFLNEGQPADIAYAHHGSLSQEIRLAVERRFKEGRLPALVATSSLELGIDIGDLDEVLLVQSPFSVASTVQRVGRAGHAVGAVSRGRFYPLFGRDLLRSAVVSAAALAQRHRAACADRARRSTCSPRWCCRWWPPRSARPTTSTTSCAPATPTTSCRAGSSTWCWRCSPAATPTRECASWCRASPSTASAAAIKARPGAARWLYTAGGTIPDRGYFHLRLQGSLARLGELDEEFVWERGIGDRFVLGAQTWRIAQITAQRRAGDAGRRRRRHGAVLEGRGQRRLASTWRGASASCSPGPTPGSASTRRRRCRRRSPSAARWRRRRPRTSPATSKGSARATGPALPHRRRLLVERVRDPQATDPRPRVVLHTMWGGQVNRPLAMALAAAWEERFGTRLQVTHDDDALAPGAAARAAGRRPAGAGRERAPAAAAAHAPRELRLLRRPLPRERRPRPAAAARRPAPPRAAVAQPPAQQAAARRGARLRRLPAAARDLAHLPAGRDGPRHAARPAGRGRARRDRGRRGDARASPRPSPPTWAGSRPTS